MGRIKLGERRGEGGRGEREVEGGERWESERGKREERQISPFGVYCDDTQRSTPPRVVYNGEAISSASPTINDFNTNPLVYYICVVVCTLHSA